METTKSVVVAVDLGKIAYLSYQDDVLSIPSHVETSRGNLKRHQHSRVGNGGFEEVTSRYDDWPHT